MAKQRIPGKKIAEPKYPSRYGSHESMVEIDLDSHVILKDKEGYYLTTKEKMDKWEYPLHMIDFETSAVALPFFKGMKPYETLAFQFSHHTIDEDWNIKHENQYICFVKLLLKNCFPHRVWHSPLI